MSTKTATTAPSATQKDQILKKLSSRITSISCEVDGEKTEVMIKKLSIAHREQFAAKAWGDTPEGAEKIDQWCLILSMCVCDDNGELTMAYEELRQMDADIVTNLGIACLKANHLTEADFAALSKNLNGTDAGQAVTASQSPSDAQSTNS